MALSGEVCLVRNSSNGLHYIVRVVREEECFMSSYGVPVVELNQLLAAKTQAQVLKVIDGMPPLVPSWEFAGNKRIFTIEEFLNWFDGELLPPDAVSLSSEFFLDSAKTISGRMCMALMR